MMSTLHSFKNTDLETDRGREKYMKYIFIEDVLIWLIETYHNIYNESFVII